jgi:hypothetical protein
MALVSGSLLGLAALGKLAGGVKTAGALGAAAKIGGGKILGTAGSRMAGGKLAGLGKTMLGRLGPIGFGSKEAVTNTALMFGPDLAFGAMAGAMTPGDLGDKLIAGGMTGISGAVGGAGLRSMYGGSNAAVQMGLELGGGVTTPYEKMAADQQKELEQQILSRYLSGKGGYPMDNGIV